MHLRKAVRSATILGIILINVGCDQVSKSIVRQKIDYNETISVIDNFFILTKIENTGAFLSFGDSLPAPVRFFLLFLLPLVALLAGIYYLLNETNLPKHLMLGISFIIGGGIGNLIDRMLYGSVTDFFHMNFVIFQTGIFNIADVSISFGTILIFIHLLLKRTEHQALQSEED